MKYLYLIPFILFLSACTKDEVYAPFNLKNGQEVELLVDHRYAAVNETLLIMPQNEPAQLSVHGFSQRKPGYIYRIKAKFNIDKNPPQDASDRWFNLSRIISEERYQGNEPFDITLIKAIVPGGPVITMQKKDDRFFYIEDKLQLTYANETVKNQLEEIWLNVLEVRDSWTNGQQSQYPKWKSIKATVTHDPNNFGKAYLVQHIEFLK